MTTVFLNLNTVEILSLSTHLSEFLIKVSTVELVFSELFTDVAPAEASMHLIT